MNSTAKNLRLKNFKYNLSFNIENTTAYAIRNTASFLIESIFNPSVQKDNNKMLCSSK